MISDNLLKLAKEWFEKGNHDLQTAQILDKEKGPTDTLCFHCQQAVEKYLKGFLVFCGKDIEEIKIHDLGRLLNYCLEEDKKFEQFYDYVDNLNRFYIDSRYPINMPFEYSQNEVTNAIGQVEEMVKFVKKSTQT